MLEKNCNPGISILGFFIAEGQRKGTIASQNTYSGNQFEEYTSREYSTLGEIGLTAKQSSTFQQIASIPEEKRQHEDAARIAISLSARA